MFCKGIAMAAAIVDKGMVAQAKASVVQREHMQQRTGVSSGLER